MTMKAADLKKGSIVQIIINLSDEKMDDKVLVTVDRVTEKFIWFKGNHLQRMGRNTFDWYVTHYNYKIISI